MKIQKLNPEHRCVECKSPLIFQHNYTLTPDELLIEVDKLTWWQCLSLSRKLGLSIDAKRQYWTCSKCHEEYLIDKRGKENE